MKIIQILVAFAATALIGSAEAYQVKKMDLSTPLVENFYKTVIAKTMSKLPEEFQRLRFNIKAKKILGRKLNPDLCGKNKNIYGLQKGFFIPTLTIHSDLIELAYQEANQNGKDITPLACKHGSYVKTLQATLLHELVHIYDRKKRLSKDQRFLDMIGGRYRKLGLFYRLHNAEQQRSHDSYELKSAKESLAVNFEYYMLDDEFQCRKPAYFNHLKRELGFSPFPSKECVAHKHVLLHSNLTEDNLNKVIKLDVSRIYQIHHLFAGKAKAIMSRWGHTMYRLVVCAPHRAVVGPDCLNDVSYHVVLSYRGNISNFTINYISGLFGEYPSEVFVYTMAEIAQEYNKLEFRDLWSAPLKLSRSEISQFVDLAIERFWTYRGRYYFMTNNCGTESLKHERAVRENDNIFEVSSLTPKKFYNDMLKKKYELVDFSEFDPNHREKMQRLGYLFVSAEDDLKNAMNNLSEESEEFSTVILDKLLEMNPDDRLARYRHLFLSSRFNSLERNKKLLVSLNALQVEAYAALMYKFQLPDVVFQEIKKIDRAKDKIEKLMEKYPLMFVNQWKVIAADQGYGVPSLKTINLGLEQIAPHRENNDLARLIQEVLGENEQLNKVVQTIKVLDETESFLKEQVKQLIKL